jgi:mRNA degradation ribonuclease J1/J2
MDIYKSQITLGAKPDTLEEFFRRGLIANFDMNIRACFLSHAHPDHCLALPALFNSNKRPQAIWATKTTSRQVKKIQFIEKPFHLDPFDVEDYYEDSITEGQGLDVKIALYPVDHDAPGACSYFAIVNNRLLIYTGDFRDHGFLSGIINKQFWKYAEELCLRKNFDSCSIICEGTNFGLPFDFRSQQDFDARLLEIVHNYQHNLISLVINVDGVWDIFSAIRILRTQKIIRKIVLSKSLIDFLKKIRESFFEDYQRVVTEPGMVWLCDIMNLGQYLVYDPSTAGSLELLKTISQQPSDYLLFLTRNEAFEALDKISIFSRSAGGCCVISFSAYEGNTDDATRTFARAIGHMGFCVEKTNALARGHISPHRLSDILKVIKPDNVFVVHTLAPDGLKAFLRSYLTCNVVAPTLGEDYQL